jgi:hypothetical protein
MGYFLLHTGRPSAHRLLQRADRCVGVESTDAVTDSDTLIRWGHVNGDDCGAYVMNPRRAIENVLDRSEFLYLLHVNGIRSPLVEGAIREGFAGDERKLPIIRHYRVPVFNMRALRCFRSDGRAIWLSKRISRVSENFKEVPVDIDKQAARVARLAVRAVHAAGLDFGLVSVGISPKGWPFVLDISCTPHLKGRLLDLYAEALNEYMTVDSQQESNPSSFTMGADLEFMLRNSEGKMVMASKYFPRKGSVGCDDRSVGQDSQRFPLAELRPDAADSPLRLVENIRETMTEALGMARRSTLQWIAGSMPFRGYSIGGHIHYSGIPCSSRLVKALDTYVGLPVMMIENGRTASRRRPRYGFLGDVRFKSHGGFEYRTPGSWIVTPEIATAVLCLAYIVGVHYRELTWHPFTDVQVQQAFYSADKRSLLPLFEKAWSDLEETSTYPEYKSKLTVIPEMVQQGISWNEGVDIRRSWHLKVPRNAQKKQRYA